GKHVLGQAFRCDRNGCDYENTSKDRFIEHMSGHISDEKSSIITFLKPSDGPPYVCEYGCGQSFSLHTLLRKHRHSHVTDGIYRCDGDGCIATYNLMHRLKAHIAVKHGAKYRCDREGCGFTTGVLSTLTNHKAQHIEGRQFTCGVKGCGKAFKVRKSLDSHIREKHPELADDKPWLECQHPDCQYRTKVESCLTKHEDRHTKPYVCDECGLTFGFPDLLKRHLRTHDKSTRLQCQWPGCDKTFATPEGLKIHLNIHSAEVKYKCVWPGCDRVYLYEATLRRHEVKHRGQKLGGYQCRWPDCGYKTTNQENLRTHMNKHLGVDRHSPGADDYKCSYMGCMFASNKSARVKCGSRDNQKNDERITRDESQRSDVLTVKEEVVSDNDTEVCIESNDSDDSQSGSALKTPKKRKLKSNRNETKDKESDEEYSCGASDEEISHNSDIHCKPSVERKRLKRTKINGKYVCDYNDCHKSYPYLGGLQYHQRSHSGQTFFCDYNNCCQHFQTWADLKNHEFRGKHVLGKAYKCEHNSCYYKTSSKDQFIEHMSGHTSDEKPREGQYVCEHVGCKQRFNNPVSLRNHKHVHLGVTYRCDVPNCTFNTLIPSALRDHATHLHGEDYRCDHEGCAFTTGKKSKYLRHQLKHSTERRFQCLVGNECQLSFKTKRHLRQHQLRLHPDAFPDIPWMECSHTDCQFRTKLKLQMFTHKNTHTKPYRCDQCGHAFMDNQKLQQHIPTHNQGRHMRCQWPGCDQCIQSPTATHNKGRHMRCQWPGCDQTFAHKGLLTRHMKIHTAETVYRCECEGCDYITPYKANFVAHVKRHTSGHVSGQPFRCRHSGCDYTTESSVEFKNHTINSHSTATKPRGQYACDRQGCDYRANEKRNLIRHQKLNHSTERPFHCSLDGCHQKYAEKYSLTFHQLTAHPDAFPDVPWIQCSHTGCEFRTKVRRVLKRHEFTHTKPFACDRCSHTFPTGVDLRVHMLSHDPSLRVRCQWPGCDQTFTTNKCSVTTCLFETTSKEALEEHICSHSLAEGTPNAVKASSRLYFCDYDECCKYYANVWPLRKHISSGNHVFGQPFRCLVRRCAYETTSKDAIEEHMSGHERVRPKTVYTKTPDGKYVCDYVGCGKRYKDHKCFHEHRRRHDPNAGPHENACESTGCSFKTKWTVKLVAHTRNTHTLPFECDVCGKAYGTKERYEDHQRSHDPALRLRCEWPGCDREFIVSDARKQHMNTHTATESYRCHWPGCEKLFNHKRAFATHVRRHKNQSTYRCYWPEWEFTTYESYSLNVHIKKHIGKDDYRCSHSGCTYETTSFDEMDAHLKGNQL
ncbi:unnamed protein product, partial [Oppiella nova]